MDMEQDMNDGKAAPDLTGRHYMDGYSDGVKWAQGEPVALDDEQIEDVIRNAGGTYDHIGRGINEWRYDGDVLALIREAIAIAAAPKAAPPQSEPDSEPLGYLSPQQIAQIADKGADGGTYMPMRKTPAGQFTLPVFIAPWLAAPKAAPPNQARNAARWRHAFVESDEFTYAVCKWDGEQWLPIKTADDEADLDAAIERARGIAAQGEA